MSELQIRQKCTTKSKRRSKSRKMLPPEDLVTRVDCRNFSVRWETRWSLFCPVGCGESPWNTMSDGLKCAWAKLECQGAYPGQRSFTLLFCHLRTAGGRPQKWVWVRFEGLWWFMTALKTWQVLLHIGVKPHLTFPRGRKGVLHLDELCKGGQVAW